MSTRPSHAAFGIAIAAALAALPACDKKKDSGTGGGPPGGYQGSKGGPPSGGQPIEPGLPSPPAAGPHLTYNAPTAQNSKNNFVQIGLAFHNFHDAYNGLPVGIADATGKPGLSWRVAILPYIQQDPLYKQFKLNEPWNGEHNKKLISQMPKLYAPPGIDTSGYTYCRSFSGQGAIMTPSAQKAQPGQPIMGMRFTQVTDGLSNTLLAAEANEPVIWTKPDDLPFSPGKPPKLGGAVFGDGFHALFCDGSVRYLKNSAIDQKTLSNLIQANDGQIVNLPP